MYCNMSTPERPILDDEITKDKRFKDRVVIVTGGASGIGRATVERFANDGASVAIFDIDDVIGPMVAEDLTKSGHKVTFLKVDVANKSECLEGVVKVAEANGWAVHHLVNNAAYFDWKGLDAEREDWHNTMTVNVEGYANMVQACYPYMKTGKDCTIVNVSGNSAHRAEPNRWTYSASKGAIVSMTKCMALDLGQDGIRVNCVSSASVWSPAVSSVVFGDRAESQATIGQVHILQRVAMPSEVAAAITFLSSRDASFFTGADIPVDGGHSAMSPEGFGIPKDDYLLNDKKKSPVKEKSLEDELREAATDPDA